MNERIVEAVLDDDGADGPTPLSFERLVRAGVFCALAFLAFVAGSVVAAATAPLVAPGDGFAAGHATGVLTVSVAVLLLRRCWKSVGAVLPDPDGEE